MSLSFPMTQWIVLPVWAGIAQSVEGIIWSAYLSSAVHLLLPMDWDLHHWFLWFTGLHSQSGFIPPASLGLQFADRGSWDFSASIIIWASSSQHISLYMLLAVFLWKTLIQTYINTNSLPWHKKKKICLLPKGRYRSCKLWSLYNLQNPLTEQK